MFLFNLFTTDDRVKHNIDRINRNKNEPVLNILMLQYKYDKDPIKKAEIERIAIEHEFNDHLYLGIRVRKNTSGKIEIILNK